MSSPINAPAPPSEPSADSDLGNTSPALMFPVLTENHDAWSDICRETRVAVRYSVSDHFQRLKALQTLDENPVRRVDNHDKDHHGDDNQQSIPSQPRNDLDFPIFQNLLLELRELIWLCSEDPQILCLELYSGK